jgi:hypothetical protein
MREVIAPFRIANGYGLFRVMTTQRIELVVEGSDDGRRWSAYEFRYKPGDLSRRPGFVAPHQPRLDWQMWFVPLGPQRQNPWFARFVLRLFEGSPPVLALLAHNPFPDHPPKFIRVMAYEYHFTDSETRARNGAWWRRERKGAYFPPLSMEDLTRGR